MFTSIGFGSDRQYEPILVGVPSTWQRIVVGLIVLVASGIFSLKIDLSQLLSFRGRN